MIRVIALLVVLAASALASEAPWQRLAAATERAASDEPGDRRAAISALKELVLDEPGLHAAHYNLGSLLLAEDAAAAARHLQQAADAPQPGLRVRALHNLALARHQLGQLEVALAAATEAATQAPDDQAVARTRDELQRLLLERRDAARRAALQPKLAERELPPAWVAEAYATQLVATGGDGGPYRFAVGEGHELPAGLSLGPDGALAGTPTIAAEGDHQLAVTIADGADRAGADRAHLVVLPTPAILTETLPPALRGMPYEAELRAQGMIGPSWSATGLPPGLRIEGAGDRARLIGTTDVAGEHALTLRAQDAYHAVERTLTLRVSADRFAAARERLEPATAWRPYRARATVRGPEGEYRWHGEPVGGLHIAEDGSIGGEPAAAGELELPVTISDDSGESVAATLHITVNPPPVIETGQVIQLARGQAADAAVEASGGTPPLVWEAVDPLPPGLSLSPGGRIVGLPAEVSEAEVVLRVTDRWGAWAEAPVTIRIAEPPENQGEGEGEDQQEQDGEQQGEEGQQGQDGQPGQDGQQGQDGQPDQDGEQGQDGQQDPGDRPPEQPGEGEGDEGEQGEDQAPPLDIADAGADGEGGDQAAADAARQAQRLDEAAALRWLDQLPEEESGIEMFLLPEGATGRSRQEGQTW